MLHDLSLIVSCWFLTLGWQIAALPFLYLLFKNKLVDGGWAFGRVISWVILSTLLWFGAHLGLPVNTSFGIYLVFGGLGLVGYYLLIKRLKVKPSALIKFYQDKRVFILLEEGLFLFGFFFLSLVRGFNPAILDLEKFMDAGLMVAYTREPTLPLEDMWLAGEKVNYYTFGHFLGSVAMRFWGLKIDFAYNLLLGLIMGLVLSQSFSLGINLAGTLYSAKLKKVKDFAQKPQLLKKLILPGLIASFLITLAGNGHSFWYLVTNQGFKDYWYPDATRFIERTIHEFPAYSFIVSDLHAHVWSLPLVLLNLVLLGLWLKALVKEKTVKCKKIRALFNHEFILRAIIAGAWLGLIVGTSAWDVLIYGLFLVITGLVLLFFDFRYFKNLFLSAVVMLVSLMLFASPWWLNFVSISEGVKVAKEHSPFWQLAVLWAGHFGLSLVAFFFAQAELGARLAIKTSKETSQHVFQVLMKNYGYILIISLVLTALGLLTLPELVYVKDIYPNHPRANTMFKLTFQALVLMSLVVSWLVAFVQQDDKFEENFQLSLKLLVFGFILAVGIYPYFGYRDYYNRLKNYQGLDGLAWLRKENLADYQAVNWLRDHVVGRPVIVEAVGESYTKHARLSTFTGLPTVLGWRVHEWLWRGSFDIPSQRTEEVRQIYQAPASPEAQQLLDKYQVKYLYVGQLERTAYPELDEAGLKKLGETVFAKQDSYLIKL